MAGDALTPVIHPSGFRLTSGPGPTAIWIESDRVDDCISFYQREGLSRIALSRFMGFYGADLDFLKDYPDVRGVWLSDLDKVDISGLYFLKESMESLRLGDNLQPLDLSRFRNLEEFRGRWHPNLLITEECRRLQVLAIDKYRPRSKDLSGLAELPGLVDLSLVQSPLISIKGVGRFPRLKRLELSYLTKLESVAAVGELKNGQLEILDCDVCRKMRDHETVKEVSSLRVVKFNDCGEMPSIDFLENMPHLKEFRFVGTNIADGNLNPLLRLDSVGFFKKKHYSHTPEEVDAIISQREA